MSVVRAHELKIGQVRPFVAARPASPELSVVPEPDPLLIAALAERDALDKDLTELREASRIAIEAARREGHEKGLAAAKANQDEQLAVLSRGVDAALAEWRERITQSETLAALFTHAALAKLFENPEDRAELVLGLIARQIAGLRSEALLSLEVSRADFPDPSDLEERLPALEGAKIRSSIALKSGECRLNLKTGQVDLGIPTQWPALSKLLLEFAGGGCGE